MSIYRLMQFQNLSFLIHSNQPVCFGTRFWDQLIKLFPHPSGGKTVEILQFSRRIQRPEKPCVGGSIPPRATSPSPFIDAYRGIFCFMDKVHKSSGSTMVAQPWSNNVITLSKKRRFLPLC